VLKARNAEHTIGTWARRRKEVKQILAIRRNKIYERRMNPNKEYLSSGLHTGLGWRNPWRKRDRRGQG